MENNEIGMRTNDIIASLTYYRLLESLTTTTSNIDKNILEAENTSDNIFKKGLVKTKNAVRKANIDNLNKEKAKTEATIEQFKKDLIDGSIYQYGESKEELKAQLDDFLNNDHDDYLKYQIALTVVIDSRYPHAYEDETLMKLSTLMFGDENRLGELKKMISKNLRALLSDQKLEKVSRTALITLGIAISATSLLTAGVAAAGALTGTNIVQVFANLAAQAAKKLGTGALIAMGTTAGVAAAGCLIAATGTCAKDVYEDEKAYKEALRTLKPTDLASTLAIRITLIELAKDKTSKDKLKEYKDAVLKDADYIRQDAEYLYIIEHSDEKDCKTKATICNKAVECLAAM